MPSVKSTTRQTTFHQTVSYLDNILWYNILGSDFVPDNFF